MTRATQIAVSDRRTLVHLSLQATCIASLLFSLDGRDPARPAAPPDHGPVASTTDAANAMVALRLDVGVVPLGIAVVERGEVTRVIAGPLRAELTADGVALADDRFAFRIIAAARAAPGAAWLFLADDGTVARARSFLGPLEPLGHVPRPANGMIRSATASQGRLAIRTLDPDASLWTTDGTAPVAPAHGLPPGIAVSAAFVDADHGMIVVEGGALFVTRDGMRSFARVDVAGAAARSVAAMNGALYVTTSSGVAVFDRDGARRDGPGGVAVPEWPAPVWLPVSQRDAAVYRRVFTAVLRRHGALVAEAFYGTITADGRPVVVVDHPRDRTGVHTLVALDGPSPDVDLTALEQVRPCVVRRWGDQLALACDDGLFRADGKTLRRTALTEDSLSANLALSSDGVHAALPCGKSLCLLDGSRVIRNPLGSDRLLGFHGSAAVVWRPLPDVPALILIDAATGAEQRSFSLRGLPSGAGTADRWQLTADGAAAIAVATAPDPARGERRLLRLSLSDGTVTTVQLPRGASRAGFLSIERGVAAGEDASTLWLTSDGGASWHARPAVSGVNRSIRCDAGRCLVDDRVVVSFERPIPGPTDRVLASPEPSAAPPVRQWQGLDCEVSDTPRRTRNRAGLCNGELDEYGWLRFHNPGADVQLTVTSEGRWTAAWHGRDARGAYTTRRTAGELGPPGSNQWYELARATREGIAISDVVTTDMREVRSLVWMPANGEATRVSAPDLPGAEVDDLLTLPTGELAVLLRFKGRDQAGRYDPDYHRLLVVDRHGRVRARRTYSWDWNRNGAIAFLDGTAGVQWAETDPARPRWFAPVDAAAPSRALAAVDVAAVSVCEAAPAADVASITVEGPERQDWSADQGKAIERLYWRGGERACVQAVEARQPQLQGRDVFASASPRGGLRTVLDLPDLQKLRTLRCELTTQQGGEPPHRPEFGDSWGAWSEIGTCPAPARP